MLVKNSDQHFYSYFTLESEEWKIREKFNIISLGY